MRSPLRHHIERSVMTTIQVTEIEFKAAQERLASFLEKKYNIKSQSSGLLEYGAAVILGYDNHHQLKTFLAPEVKPTIFDAIFDEMDVALLVSILMDNRTREFVLKNNPSEDFTDKEVTMFLTETYSLRDCCLSPGSDFFERVKQMLNQSTNFTLNFYDSKGGYDKRVELGSGGGVVSECDGRMGGYTFFCDVMRELFGILQRDVLEKKIDNPNFYGIELFDQEYNIHVFYTYKVLQAVFEPFKTENELLRFYASIQVFA